MPYASVGVSSSDYPKVEIFLVHVFSTLTSFLIFFYRQCYLQLETCLSVHLCLKVSTNLAIQVNHVTIIIVKQLVMQYFQHYTYTVHIWVSSKHNNRVQWRWTAIPPPDRYRSTTNKTRVTQECVHAWQSQAGISTCKVEHNLVN